MTSMDYNSIHSLMIFLLISFGFFLSYAKLSSHSINLRVCANDICSTCMFSGMIFDFFLCDGSW